MPIDASIPLAAGNIQGPSPQQTMSLLEFAQQMKQRQQQQQAQNALRSIFADPNSMDETGGLKPEAINRVMQIDPTTGMRLQTNMLDMQKNRQELMTSRVHEKLYQMGIGEKQYRMLAENDGQLHALYEDLLSKGVPKPEALSQASEAKAKMLESMQASGHFSPDQIDQFRGPFTEHDPLKWDSNAYKTYRASQEKIVTDKRAEAAQAERERHDRATERHQMATESRLAEAVTGGSKPPSGYRYSKDKPGELEPIPGGPAARKEGVGLTLADKMNPVMLATVKLDITEGRKAIEFMEKAGLDKGSAFYADEHGSNALARFAKKMVAPEKEQEFDVYANKMGQAIASAQSMGRGQISDTKIREAQKAIPVMGDSKHIREVKMGQMKAFFDYVDEVLKTPIKPGARGASDAAEELQDAADFSSLWK